MARRRRRFVCGEVGFFSCRCAHGLPFVPNRYIRRLIKGILARSQERYPGIIICHFIFMTNHYHMIAIINASAEAVSRFFGYLNGELASLFHRLMGVAHELFWSDRFDAKPILDPEAVIDKIAYCYLNPVRANLVDKVSQWEGASSHDQFIEGKCRYYKWISSSLVDRLPQGPFGDLLVQKRLSEMEQSKRGKRKLRLAPYAWKSCFEESKNWTDEDIRVRILKEIKQGEQECREERIKKGIKIFGVKKLRTQSIYKPYTSKTYRRNTLCITKHEERRKTYTSVYQAFCEVCRGVWESWKQGDYSPSLPPGAFIPSMMPTASIFEPG